MKKEIRKFFKDLSEEQNGFKFGKVFRFTENSLVAILPLLRKKKKARDYVTLAEANKIKIEDTGQIGYVLITNNENKSLFIRCGEIFKGKTQERAATRSSIILPNESKKVSVVCIHQSKGINAGSEMEYGGKVPTELYHNISSGNQSNVWSSICTYTSGNSSTKEAASNTEDLFNNTIRHSNMEDWDGYSVHHLDMNFSASAPNNNNDDLVSGIKTLSKEIEDILIKTPFVKNQIGLSLFDLKGVYMVECFDIDESWKSIKDEAIRKEGNKIVEEDDNVFDYKPEKAKSCLKALLNKDYTEKSLYEDKNFSIIKIENKTHAGEVSILNGKVIHLNIIRI